MKVVTELARRAVDAGSTVAVDSPVIAVEQHGDRVAAVVPPHGRVATEWLVIAAGAWSREVGALLGLHVPVWPLKGHVLVTEPAPGFILHYVSENAYEATMEAMRSLPIGVDGPALGGPAAMATVIQPLPSGSFLIGSSREFAGFDRDVNRLRLRELAARAMRVVPRLGVLRLLRTYAGLRPWSPDGRPLVGRSAALGGLAFATGHAGDGNTGALLTGKLVAADLVGSTPPVDLRPYSPDRFDLSAETPPPGATA
jgi:glycine/D-amino acid oxidase-like deaminating enzyme